MAKLSDIQIRAFIAMPKQVPAGAFQSELPAVRNTVGEYVKATAATTNEPNAKVSFVVEVRVIEHSEIDITLKVKLEDGTSMAICRYDVHDSLHGNPPWFPPFYVEPRQSHAHIYSERAVDEGETWDRCASLLDVQDYPTIQRVYERLLGRFMADMIIGLSDGRDFRTFFKL